MVQFSSALKRTMYDFKNSFFHNFLLIHRAKYIFSRDTFCLYHFRSKIHGVCPKENLEHIVAIIKKTLTHWWPSSLNLTLACLEVKYAAWIFGIHRNFFGAHVCRVNLPLSRLIPNLRKPKCTFKSKSFLKLVTISWALLLWETGPSIEVLK